MDLSLVPVDDLITELSHRMDHFVMAGVNLNHAQETNDKKTPKGLCTDIVSVRRWNGNSYMCAGLCASIQRSILEDFDGLEEHVSPGEI